MVHVFEGSFEWALTKMKVGYRVGRQGWNGKGMWVRLQEPDELSKMTLPYIYLFTADRRYVPWTASQTDLLANDWVLLE